MQVIKLGPNPEAKRGAHPRLAFSPQSPTEPQRSALADLGQLWWSELESDVGGSGAAAQRESGVL